MFFSLTQSRYLLRSRTRQSSVPRGMTLTELLVVIAIIVILLALVVPRMRPAIEDRKIREASRAVSAQFMGAQSRAAEYGRPVGIWIERDSREPRAAFRLYYADVAPPYAGDTLSSRMTVTGSGTATHNSTTLPTLVGAGDLIRFDYKGPKYRIVTASGSAITFQRLDSNHPWPPTTGLGVPFQVFRKPTRSPLSPLELPSGIILDLSHSGFGVTGSEFAPNPPTADTTPVVVTFNPTGTVEQVYVQGIGGRPIGSVHFLIGRLEYVGPQNLGDTGSGEDKDRYAHMSNLWVSIGNNTGYVSTSENVGNTGSISEARRIATQAQTKGGR